MIDIEALKHLLGEVHPGNWFTRRAYGAWQVRTLQESGEKATIAECRAYTAENDVALMSMAPEIARRLIVVEQALEARERAEQDLPYPELMLRRIARKEFKFAITLDAPSTELRWTPEHPYDVYMNVSVDDDGNQKVSFMTSAYGLMKPIVVGVTREECLQAYADYVDSLLDTIGPDRRIAFRLKRHPDAPYSERARLKARQEMLNDAKDKLRDASRTWQVAQDQADRAAASLEKAIKKYETFVDKHGFNETDCAEKEPKE